MKKQSVEKDTMRKKRAKRRNTYQTKKLWKLELQHQKPATLQCQKNTLINKDKSQVNQLTKKLTSKFFQ